jgi:hypothetical protein
MVSENHASPRRQCDPWNKGRLIGEKRPLKRKGHPAARRFVNVAPHGVPLARLLGGEAAGEFDHRVQPCHAPGTPSWPRSPATSARTS